MQIIRSIDDYTAGAGLLLSIGVFDGVHVGHRAVLAHLLAKRTGSLQAAALTFDRHPQAFLQPGSAPPSITPVDEKINLLDAVGLDILFLLPFDERIAGLPAERFLEDVLVRRFRTKLLVVGDDWRFGTGRTGDCALARRILEPAGCTVQTADLLIRGGEKVSSSRIRSLIEERRFEEADALLGSAYTLAGIVSLGDGRGHVLGYPTANLEVAAEKLVPPDGVYAATARLDGKELTAVVSIGSKPTFDGNERAIEAYLIDFGESIYGRQLSLRRFAFVREQERFASADELIRQIERDVTAVRQRAGLGRA
jgi:riboflavin kinase / FMN adenylyltransferase